MSELSVCEMGKHLMGDEDKVPGRLSVCASCFTLKCKGCAAFAVEGGSYCVRCSEMKSTPAIPLPEVPDLKEMAGKRLVNAYVGGVLEYNTTTEAAELGRRAVRESEQEREFAFGDGVYVGGGEVKYCRLCFMVIPSTQVSSYVDGRCLNC